jgi:methyltransferase
VDLSVKAFLALLVLVALMRGVEMLISRRHQRALRASQARQVAEPRFRWMVVVHAGILIGAALEVVLLNRPLVPLLAATMAVVFLLANAVRWWVIATLGRHWNVQVMDSVALGVVTDGPYRAVRHPNYAAVFVELVALPLIHTAWITAFVGSIAHAWVLSNRLAVEDAVLLANPTYRAVMGQKPRFIPRLGSQR